jgi:hypothetical protein
VAVVPVDIVTLMVLVAVAVDLVAVAALHMLPGPVQAHLEVVGVVVQFVLSGQVILVNFPQLV